MVALHAGIPAFGHTEWTLTRPYLPTGLTTVAACTVMTSIAVLRISPRPPHGCGTYQSLFHLGLTAQNDNQ